jgi:3-ketosteroid 9alpha-monooxygenase subunit B
MRAWGVKVDMAACDILGPDDLREGLILACQATPRSAEVRVEF